MWSNSLRLEKEMREGRQEKRLKGRISRVLGDLHGPYTPCLPDKLAPNQKWKPVSVCKGRLLMLCISPADYQIRLHRNYNKGNWSRSKHRLWYSP